VSWLDTRLGRLASASLGFSSVAGYWIGDGINPFGLVFVLIALPRSPLVRSHVFAIGFMLVGFYEVGAGLWVDQPVPVVVGAGFVLFWGAGEAMLCWSTRSSQRLSDVVIATIVRQPAQLWPRYNLRLADGSVVYWPVIGCAYLARRNGWQRADFSANDVVAVDCVPRERVW
jgi:hypothetical protein